MAPSKLVTVSVIGVSGNERTKGAQGVGKSLLCNRFVRGAFDDFHREHSSILSQTDFGGSPVINNDHWLYWGERLVDVDENAVALLRVIEQTVFLDDESFEPIAGPSTSEVYCRRAVVVRLESRDKLMYIQKEQLGLEAEFPQQVLPEGKTTVDAFVFVFDASCVEGRPFDKQSDAAASILMNALKTKKPVVIVLSKMDIALDGVRKAVAALLGRKELRGQQWTVIESSAVKNVNVDEAFLSAAQLALKTKHRVKALAFCEAFRVVCEEAIDARTALEDELRRALPMDEWPSRRLSWGRLLSEFGLERNHEYIRFVRIYGECAARRVYEQHVMEAREHWMQTKLKLLAPQLPRVFSALLPRRELLTLTWSDANRRIHSHLLFDEFFQPLGALGKQLEPLSPEEVAFAGGKTSRPDQRIPAEILLRTEARTAYEDYQRVVEQEQRREQLEEDFETLLTKCPQVTPGRPLSEVRLFLSGNPAFDSLAPAQVALLYDRYQTDLVKRAEADFSECLLENVELFVEVALRRFPPAHCRPAPSHALADHELAMMRTVLQEDVRYRLLSRLWELRDGMLKRFCSFIAHPLTSACPARSRCADSISPEQISAIFNKHDIDYGAHVHVVKIVVHGEIGVVAKFITDMACALRGDPFQSACGLARIHCVGADDETDEESADGQATQLYLLANGSCPHLPSIRNELSPPLFVLVADPAHFDQMPLLHQQGSSLAESCHGIFIGAGGESEGGRGFPADSSTLFTREQLYRILDVACGSQLDGRRADVRVRLSCLCADPLPLDVLLRPLEFSSHLRTLPPSESSQGGVVPLDAQVDSSGRWVRIDIRVGSYHSWLADRQPCPAHGHILVYTTRRTASWVHVRAAVARLLEDGPASVTGRAIMVVAVSDVCEQPCRGEENELLREGRELAESIGAVFVAAPADGGGIRAQAAAFLELFCRVHSMAPLRPMSGSVSSGSNQIYASLSSGGCSDVHSNETTSSRRGSNTVSLPLARSQDTSRCGGTMVSVSSSPRSSRGPLSSSPYQQRAHTAMGISDCGSPQAPPTGIPQMTSLDSRRPPTAPPATSAARPVRRRVAPAPPALFLPSASSVFVPRSRVSLIEREQAPLATPELVDIAAEYSSVQDADEHIYATLQTDYSILAPTKERRSPKDFRHGDASRARPLAQSSPSASEPSNSASAFCNRSPSISSGAGPPEDSAVHSQPSDLAVGCSVSTSTCRNNLPPQRIDARSGRRFQSRVEDRPTERRQQVQLPSNFFATRSVTMDVIGPCAERPKAVRDLRMTTAPLRHSVSAESLAAEGGKREKKSGGEKGFVRKVAASFRLRGARPAQPADPRLLGVRGQSGARSVPHSPHSERKAVLKGAFPAVVNGHSPDLLPSVRFSDELPAKCIVLWLLIAASCEKVSTAFSWLPSRSPKRSGRAVSAELQAVTGGHTLSELAKDGTVPAFIVRCIHYIEREGGLELEGLYRVPGNQSQLADVERQFHGTSEIDLSGMELPVHVVATALKNFFARLAEPVVPRQLHDGIANAVSDDDPDQLRRLRAVLAALPPANRETLSFLLAHLSRVAASPATAMDSGNLSKVWWPTLFRPEFATFDAMTSGTARLQRAAEALLSHSDALFPSVP